MSRRLLAAAVPVVLGLGLSLGGIAACSAEMAARIRQHTYPPDFQYITKADLQSTMWQLASLVSQLDAVLRAEAAVSDAKRAEAEHILSEMHEASLALGPGGWPSNHPSVSRNVERFRRDLKAARRALELEPPSFYLAGSISGACLHCHEDD